MENYKVILQVEEDCFNLNDFILLTDYIKDGGYSYKIIKCPKEWRRKVD